MSYYVYITRKPNPYWKGGPEIREAEWREVALAEPNFILATDFDKSWDARPSDFVWTGHPSCPDISFDWSEGQINVRTPDPVVLAVMGRLAARLNAHLIGEDGGRFDSSGKSLGIAQLPEEPGTKKPSWWRRMLGGGA